MSARRRKTEIDRAHDQYRKMILLEPDLAAHAGTMAKLAETPPDEIIRQVLDRSGYRTMLQKERPQIVAVADRFPDSHHDMVLACAAAGVTTRCWSCASPPARRVAPARRPR